MIKSTSILKGSCSLKKASSILTKKCSNVEVTEFKNSVNLKKVKLQTKPEHEHIQNFNFGVAS
jgi:hypothetical protein